MLTVIPGMSYLKTLVPCAPMAPLTHTSDTSAREMRVPPDLHHATVLLVTVALGVAFGRRPLAHITPQRFSSGVRIHVSARLRQSTVRGAARLRSLHIFPLVVPSTPHDDAPPLPASTNTDTAASDHRKIGVDHGRTPNLLTRLFTPQRAALAASADAAGTTGGRFLP